MEIPSSVTSIGVGVFDNCTGLTAINVNDNSTYKSVDGVLFSKDGTWLIECPVGKSGEYTIPTGVTSIDDYAFDYCQNLTSIEIPSDVVAIGSYAFRYCKNLTSIEIPSGVTTIGSYAFCSCHGLTSVTIPSSVTSIGVGVFDNCTGLTAINVNDNSNYKSVDGVLFSKDGTGLIECPVGKSGKYTIPDGVTSIDDYAFDYCQNLTSVEIPSGVADIGSYAFRYCSGLTSITIPSSVTDIGSYAFHYCSKLTSIIIPSGVTNISNHAFSNCSKLTSVTIPSGVTSIGDAAFYGCSSLASVEIPSSVTSIDSSAFSGCTKLTDSLTIPNSVTSIGDRAFYNCTGLAEITVLNKYATINSGGDAFYGVPKLRCFKGSTASEYSGTATEIVYVQDQSSLETILIQKPTDGKWIQKVELIISGTEILKTAELTQYRLDGENYVFPVFMYANKCVGDERRLSYQVEYYYNYESKEASTNALNTALPASEDNSGGTPDDPSKVYYAVLSKGDADFKITEVATS